MRFDDIDLLRLSARERRKLVGHNVSMIFRTQSCLDPSERVGRQLMQNKLEGITRRYFDKLGIPVHINYSWGATEAKVVEGLADAIVEVTETETIRAHGLRVIDEVLATNAVLIAGRAAWEDPVKRRKIEQIDLLLPGRLAGRIPGLPQDERPLPPVWTPSLTCCPLSIRPPWPACATPAWLSLETVVDADGPRPHPACAPRAPKAPTRKYTLNKVI